MIRRNGQIFRLETPHTTLVIKADTAEYLYYGKKLVSSGDFEACYGLPCKLLSQFGQELAMVCPASCCRSSAKMIIRNPASCWKMQTADAARHFIFPAAKF